MFIFFFKQKTAYEMRISDWSSDVCSSDLLGDARACVVEDVAGSLAAEPEVARRLLHLYNMMAERRGWLLLSDREAPARWRCPLPDLHSRLAATQAVAPGEPDEQLVEAVQIGRASCRERVCQSV